MTIADMVYTQVKQLPDSLAREVLDFVGFLREGRDRAEWRDLMNAQTTGLAGRIVVNAALVATPSNLVAYAPTTASGDPR